MKKVMVETNRMNIYPLSLDRMDEVIKNEPEFEGQGLTTEAVVAMCQWAIKQEGVNCIEAETDPDNRASQRVLEKAGFLPNGVIGEEGPRFVWRG